MSSFSITKINAWAPGVTSDEEWLEWSQNKRDIIENTDTPALKHLPPTARRRISQLSKMVLEVGHQLSLDKKQRPIIFVSQMGEINKQNQITRGLLDDGEVRPAAFSLSVFNTPTSLLSIHEKNSSEQIILYPGENSIFNALFTLISEIKTNSNKEFLIIFADESLPEDYKTFKKEGYLPYCFGLIISSNINNSAKVNINYKINQDLKIQKTNDQSPLALLKWILSDINQIEFTLDSSSITLTKKP